MAGRFSCEGPHPNGPVPATEFCLCGKQPIQLCLGCWCDGHQDSTVHDRFPIVFLEQYLALGKKKAEWKRHYEDINKREKFLDRATVQEATVQTQATSLITDFAKGYQGVLDRNHRCFLFLVDQLKRELALLMTKREVDFSLLTQMIIDRSHSLGVQEEKYFCLNPETEEMKEFREHCSLAVVKDPGLQQREYEEEVLQTFRKQAQAPEQRLVGMYENKVRCYDFKTGQWKQLYPVSLQEKSSELDRLQVDDSSASAFIPPNQVFVCGGGTDLTPGCTCNIDYTAYMLGDDGTHQQLPNMITARQNPGIIWDPDRNAVYVFGGFWGDSINMTAMSTGEQFHSNAWTGIASMHAPRYGFNPCMHSSLVYLCGGDLSVETYDPQSNTCTLLNFVLPEAGTALDDCGVLTIISPHYIFKVHNGKLISKLCKNEFGSSWFCAPVVIEGVAYFTKGQSVWGVDLLTGVGTIHGK